MRFEDIMGEVTFEEIKRGELECGVMLITKKGVYFPPAYHLNYRDKSDEGMIIRCGLKGSDVLASVIAEMVVNENVDSGTIIYMVKKAIERVRGVLVDNRGE